MAGVKKGPLTTLRAPATSRLQALQFQRRQGGSVGSLNSLRDNGPLPSKLTPPGSGSLTSLPRTEDPVPPPPESDPVTSVTSAHLGEVVCILEQQRGVLRYFGATQFQPGVWCGIELPEEDGKNDGSVDGVRYFTCQTNRGIFAPLRNVSLLKESGVNEVKDLEESLGDVPLPPVAPEAMSEGTKGSKRPKKKEGRKSSQRVPSEEPKVSVDLKRRKLDPDARKQSSGTPNLREELEAVHTPPDHPVGPPTSTSHPLHLTSPEDTEQNTTFTVHSKGTLTRPSTLGLGPYPGDQSSEDSSEAGILGVTTPSLLSGLSMALSLPTSPESGGDLEQEGLQEQEALGLLTPSRVDSWGLSFDDDLYAHLRSPSLDDLDLDPHDPRDFEDDTETTEEDPNATIAAPSKPPQEDKGLENVNRNARVIDGALYTSCQGQVSQKEMLSSVITVSSASEMESSSSGFYSDAPSSDSDSRSTRHLSSDCDDSTTTTTSLQGLLPSSPNTSKVPSDEEGTLQSITTDNSFQEELNDTLLPPEEEDEDTPHKTLHHFLHPHPPTTAIKTMKTMKSVKGRLVESLLSPCSEGGGGGRGVKLEGKQRSQSVSCISSLLHNHPHKRIVPPTRESKEEKGRERKGVMAETVASKGRRGSASQSQLSAGVSAQKSGSVVSVASVARSPGPQRKGSKWDKVMETIDRNKHTKINVKDVKSKVFDRVRGSTANLAVTATTTTPPSATGTSTSGQSGSGGVGKVKGQRESGDKRTMVQTDSTSSDEVPSRTITKHRGRKDAPRRQVSDMSSASETSVKLPANPTTTRSTSNSASSTNAPPKKSKPVIKSASSRTTPTESVPNKTKATTVTTTNVNGTTKETTTKGGNVAVQRKKEPPSTNKGGLGTVGSTKVQVVSKTKPPPEVKPLRVQNRVAVSAPKESKSESSGPTSNSTSNGRKGSENVGLKEQVARLKEQFERLQLAKDAELAQKESELKEKELKVQEKESELRESQRDFAQLALDNLMKDRAFQQALELVAERERDGEEQGKKADAFALVIQHQHTQVESLEREKGQLDSHVRELKERAEESAGLRREVGAREEQLRALEMQLNQLVLDHNDQLTHVKSGLEDVAELRRAHQSELERLREAHKVDIEQTAKAYRHEHQNQSPHDLLVKDVKSLEAVLEMKNEEIRQLRKDLIDYTATQEALGQEMEHVRTLQAKVEDVEAQLEKARRDKRAGVSRLAELERLVGEVESRNAHLLQVNDELSWKMANGDATPNSSFSPNSKHLQFLDHSPN